MKKYLMPFAFISFIFFYGCFFFLLIGSYSTKTIIPSSKNKPDYSNSSSTNPVNQKNSSAFLSSK